MVVVGAELVGVENGEGGGKKATRSSRHQIGAVCVFFRSRVLFFFFPTIPPNSFSCFVLKFFTKFLDNLLTNTACVQPTIPIQCWMLKLSTASQRRSIFNVQTRGKENKKKTDSFRLVCFSANLSPTHNHTGHELFTRYLFTDRDDHLLVMEVL